MARSGTTIAGKAGFRVDGKIYNCTDVKVKPGSETVEKVTGFEGVAGDKVTPVAPSATATVIVTPDVNVKALLAIRDKTVGVRCADGRAYTLEGASQTLDSEHDLKEGTLDVAFSARSCTEN